MSESNTIKPACPKACASCPWRTANQGSKPDPHKFYTTANLKRLWRGLRDGARMSCHPTDPRMAEFAGYESLGDRTSTNECTGGLILQQREFMLFQQMMQDAPESKTVLRDYRRERPNGMTKNGLVSLVNRVMFAPLDRVEMSKPNLVDPEVGFALIDTPRGAK